MDSEDYRSLCIFAFDVLVGTLNKLDHSKLKFPDNFKDKTYPLFVTWSTGPEKNLRGCIGTFSKENLEKNLLLYAYYAAFKDNRFMPISKVEIPHLHCGVSLLVNFEDGKDAFDWEVGKHGITIDFESVFEMNHHATFLPEVACDRNWDKKTTLKNLIKKAGYYGKLDEVVDKIKLTRYQSIKIGITHDEYKCHKESLNEFEFVIY
jgi:uncharacterized protein (TIGR00296 family)